MSMPRTREDRRELRPDPRATGSTFAELSGVGDWGSDPNGTATFALNTLPNGAVQLEVTITTGPGNNLDYWVSGILRASTGKGFRVGRHQLAANFPGGSAVTTTMATIPGGGGQFVASWPSNPTPLDLSRFNFRDGVVMRDLYLDVGVDASTGQGGSWTNIFTLIEVPPKMIATAKSGILIDGGVEFDEMFILARFPVSGDGSFQGALTLQCVQPFKLLTLNLAAYGPRPWYGRDVQLHRVQGNFTSAMVNTGTNYDNIAPQGTGAFARANWYSGTYPGYVPFYPDGTYSYLWGSPGRWYYPKTDLNVSVGDTFQARIITGELRNVVGGTAGVDWRWGTNIEGSLGLQPYAQLLAPTELAI